MADQYVTADEVKAFIGGDVYDAIDAYTGVDPVEHIETATGLVQAFLRNSGYAIASTTTDEAIKAAVIGLSVDSIRLVPEANLDMPEWRSSAPYLAWQGLLSGDIKPVADPASKGAVGGVLFSETDTTVDSTARPQRASRAKLRYY